MVNPINSMFQGHSYTNNEVRSFIDINKIDKKYNVEYFDDIEKKIAELLRDFRVVGRLSGKCEWGSRSLCNRGILANASNMKSFHEVNNLVKVRDFWMPFAPTILDVWAKNYIKNWAFLSAKANESFKYMIVAAEGTDLAKQHLIAAMHQKDYTLRPQVISKNDNRKTYALLSEYESLTSMGGILNTSLNIHGKPLAGTLEQAFFTFTNSGLPNLTLENFLISK